MSIEIRHEMPGDEDAIDVVNCRAFESMSEANIVRLAREGYPLYDRRYSVTAWDDGEMIGYTLFSPARIRFMDETIPALGVGPVAVIPERQKQGIGGQMLVYGHELGKREGFALAFLCGHPTYYPRYGYKVCFGHVNTTIDTEKLPATTQKFRRLPVRPADIPWLVERHAAEWADVDFGWLWGTSLSEWTIPGVNAVMWWTDEGQRAAYTVAPHGRGRCDTFLADDIELAREVLATLRPKALALHPSGWLAQNVLDTEWSQSEVHLGQHAMAYELQEGVLTPCLKAIEKGERLPGFTQFPLSFMAC